MSAGSTTTPKMEIAHVLFMDIVSYSKLPMDEQSVLVEELTAIVQGTEAFLRAKKDHELVVLHTGDGMVLAFFGGPEAPVRCAAQIAGVLQEHPRIQLRMGVHSGPVYRVKDIRGDENVAGGGINFAQRVMDCGDAGHILLSNTIADVLQQHSVWAQHIKEIGIAEVKHGAKVHLYNYLDGRIGNAELPGKVKAQFQSVPTASPPETAPGPGGIPAVSAPSAPVKPCKVCLVYKRNVEPDMQVLKALEEAFAAHGHEVFVDRNLKIGVEWAKEIEQRIKDADAIVPILSAASCQSEMLAYEVQLASEAAQQNAGRPRILPVRVQFEGPLPDPLAAILGRLQYGLWKDAADNSSVISQVLARLTDKKAEVTPVSTLEAVGGAVPLDSKFYIVRPTDDEFKSAIERQDSIVLVKGARQMGKTSLLARGVQVARQRGAKVALTDFQKLNATQLESPDALFLALAEMLATQLDFDVIPQEVWNPKRGPSINFERFLRREILEKLDAHLVWVLDEVDRLFSCSFASEVFGLFRSWHNERSLDPSGPWQRLTLAIGYATEAHLFISDVNQSPFNVGTRLTLSDFSLDQVAELNRRYGGPLAEGSDLLRFYKLVGGQPYLVRRGLDELVRKQMSSDEFEAAADKDEGPYGDHLRRILVLLARDKDMSDVVKEVLASKPCPTMESFYRLRSAGLLVGDTAKEVKFRCQIYSSYLKRHL